MSHVANRADSVAIEMVRTQRAGGMDGVGTAERESLAHPAARHDHAVHAEGGHDLQHHGRSSDHGVGPVGVQAADLRALLHRLAREILRG